MKARRKYRRAFPLRAFLLFLAVSAAVVVSFILWGDEINGWMNDAIASTDGNRFFVALVLFLVLASDIILPVPSSLASVSCGLFLGWKLGFAVSFAAMSVSSAVGYAIGRISSTAAEKLIGASDMASLSCFQQRFGAWTLLALRPVPVLAEASTVMSGVARQPITQVALQLALGNATVSLFYALAGAFFGNGEGTAWWAFLAAMVVTGLFFLAKAVASRLRDGTPYKRRRHRSSCARILDYKTLTNERLTMRIAVCSENGEVFQHFGHTPEFLVCEVADGKVAASEIVSSGGIGHGALAGLLGENKIDLLICGGIGGGAMAALAEAGVEVVGGVSGDAKAAVESYLAGTLAPRADFKCNHHHEDGHSCGDHHHDGEHSCGGADSLRVVRVGHD